MQRPRSNTQVGHALGRADVAPHITLLRILLGVAIASTAIHYSHNFVMAEMYPPSPPLFPDELAFRVGIAITWPLLTAIAIWGYGQYAAGRMRRAGWAFIAYSLLGITTVGHFLSGNPDIPTFFYLSIFTDFLTGTAMLIFGIATLRSAQLNS